MKDKRKRKNKINTTNEKGMMGRPRSFEQAAV